MFIAFLRFSKNKSNAKEYMAAHKDWIQNGVDDEVFLFVGSIQPNLGGMIIAHNITRDAFEARIEEDPFVIHDVVSAEVLEVTASMVDPRLSFLL